MICQLSIVIADGYPTVVDILRITETLAVWSQRVALTHNFKASRTAPVRRMVTEHAENQKLLSNPANGPCSNRSPC